MRRIRKKKSDAKPVKERNIPCGQITNTLDIYSLKKKAEPASLAKSALFILSITAFAFIMIFVISMLMKTVMFVRYLFICITVAWTGVLISIIQAIFPMKFIYKNSPLKVETHTDSIVFLSRDQKFIAARDENLKITYQLSAKKLRVYGRMCDVDETGTQISSPHIGKKSIYISETSLHQLADALYGTIKII